MPKMTVTLQSLPAESYLLLLLVVACAATDVVSGQSSSGLQFSCPGDEDLLYVGCRFIDEELLDSVKQGQSDQLSLVTQNVDRMSSICSQGCRLQMEECIPMSPAYGLAVRYCGCRSALSTACDASLAIALPVFMNPQFSVSNYYLGIDAGVPVTEELNEARSEVCGSSCRTPLETSEQCSYGPLRDAINAMCCGPISQQCSDLYTTMVELSDPTAEPEKFPDVTAFLAAVDLTTTLTERTLALSNSAGINSVPDLFLAPLREMCVKLDLTSTELSNAITSCKSECPALANFEIEAAATSLADVCYTFTNGNSSGNDALSCGVVDEMVEACMPDFSATRLISFAENSSYYNGYRRRHLLQASYQGMYFDVQWLMSEPAAMLVALMIEETGYYSDSVRIEYYDEVIAVQRSLCSAECSAQLYCPFSTWYHLHALDDFFWSMEPFLFSSDFCNPQQPTTQQPIVSSPPPPGIFVPLPTPSSAPPATQIRYFLTIVDVGFAIPFTEADARFYLFRVTDGWTPGGTIVRLLGVELYAEYIMWVVHFAIAFPALEESAVMQLTFELEDRLFSEARYFNLSSLYLTGPEEGTTLDAVNARIETLTSQYAATQPSPPSYTTPPAMSAQVQARILEIVVGIPASTNLEENYTVTLEARVVADLAALPGVSRDSVHTLSAVNGVVELAVLVVDDGGADRDDVNYQNLRTALPSLSYPSRQYGSVSPLISNTIEGFHSLGAADDMIVWMMDRANSTHFRTVRVDVQLPPTITEDDFAASLEAQFVADLAALPGIDMQNVRILRIADGVVEAAVIVADAGGIYHVDDNYQALVAAMTSPSDHFSRRFGDDLAARVVSTKRASTLSTAEGDIAALLQQAEYATFSISRVDLELSLLSNSDADLNPALEARLVSDLGALPGVDLQNIHILGVANGVAQLAVIITSAGGAYESDNAGAFRSAMYSESENFSSDLGTINARFISNDRVNSLTAANAAIAALREQVELTTFRVVRIDVELPIVRANDLFSNAMETQLITDFAALPGVNSENVNVLRVTGGVVELAVVVIDEGGADQDGHYQSLLTAMAAASDHFSNDLGDVTARVISTEPVHSLAAANQEVAGLQEQVRESGAFRVVRIELQLSLSPNEADFTDSVRAVLVSDLAALDGVDSRNVHVLSATDGVVDLAVIVTDEGGNNQKLTTAISSESELFSSELGVVTVRIVSNKVVSSLVAAETEVAALKDEVASAVSKCSAPLPLLLAAALLLCLFFVLER